MTDLDTLEALEAKATRGPWRDTSGKGSAVVSGPDCAVYLNVRTCEEPETVARWQADAAFIAAIRNAAPALFAELRALRVTVASVPPPYTVGALIAERDALRAELATALSNADRIRVRHFVEELIDALNEGEELHYENCALDDSCKCRLAMAGNDAVRILRGE